MKTARILAYALVTWGIAFVAEGKQLTPHEQLGKNLFFDSDLSTPPGQACAVWRVFWGPLTWPLIIVNALAYLWCVYHALA